MSASSSRADRRSAVSWPSVKASTSSLSNWRASPRVLPRWFRLRAARSPREVAPWRRATSSARRKQASAAHAIGAFTGAVLFRRHQDFTLEPMELRLPPALVTLLATWARASARRSRAGIQLAEGKVGLDEERQEIGPQQIAAHRPHHLQALLHQSEPPGPVSSHCHRPTPEDLVDSEQETRIPARWPAPPEPQTPGGPPERPPGTGAAVRP